MGEVVASGNCISCGICAFDDSGKRLGAMSDRYVSNYPVPTEETVLARDSAICPGAGYPIVELGASHASTQELSYETDLGYFRGLAAYRSRGRAATDRASSGGVMTEAAIFLLENHLVDGVVVTTMACSDGMPRPRAIVAETVDQVLSSQGSKYCPVPIFEDVFDRFTNYSQLAMIGTPCQIAALRLAQKRGSAAASKVIFTIGNFCGGYRDYRETDLIIRRVIGGDSSPIKNFEYRGQGQPGKMTVETELSTHHADYPDYVRLTGVPKHKRCRLCVDATAELADLSCGDAWVPRLLSSEFQWSVCVARSAQAENLLHALTSSDVLIREDMSMSELVSSQRGNLDAKKKRFRSRIALQRFLRLSRSPDFDGGYYTNEVNVFFEFKVGVSQSIFWLAEKLRVYKLLAKILNRYPI